MVNPIKTSINDALVLTYILEDEDEVLGQIKAEIFQEYVLLHPHLWKVSKGTFLRLKEMFHQVCNDMGWFYFDAVHCVTHNAKIVNMLTDNKVEELAHTPQGVIYEYGV